MWDVYHVVMCSGVLCSVGCSCVKSGGLRPHRYGGVHARRGEALRKSAGVSPETLHLQGGDRCVVVAVSRRRHGTLLAVHGGGLHAESGEEGVCPERMRVCVGGRAGRSGVSAHGDESVYRMQQHGLDLDGGRVPEEGRDGNRGCSEDEMCYLPE